MVYLTTENVGSLVWGTLAEKTSPVEGVVYTTVDEMKLISRFRTANPLVETTAGQMLALTVIEGVDQIYYQDITDAQTVDAEKEAQDSTDVKVTIWGDTYKKTEFVQELNKITGGKLTAKSADEKIDPKGPWSEPVLVKAGKGIIDTTPLWDDDGRVYLVHAYAGSRAGLKSVITICELSADASKAITQSRIIFDGHEAHQTCEGPKFYKRNGYYYIFHPAGGVPTGWQVVLRSKNVYGPYEWKTVLAQGNSPVNGPHQGGWVDTPTGEDWFMHFQDVGAYGRLVHLQPMKWVDDWPVIGIDKDGDGCGEPVLTYKKPNVGKNYPICTPQESDEFDGYTLSPQWQWQANINEKWAYFNGGEGFVRLYSYPVPEDYKSLWDVSNLMLQKTPAPNFTATTKLTFKPTEKYKGERTGLVVMGMDYAGLVVENTDNGLVLSQVECLKADRGGTEKVNASVPLKDGTIYLRAKFSAKGDKIKASEGGHDLLVKCNLSYSTDGKKFQPLGETFQVKEGKWIGAKVGIFCTRPAIVTNDGGWTDADWFRIEK